MIDRRCGERGTTLLEALIAMSILVIGSLGVIGINNVGLRLNDDARKLTRASAIAQDLVENVALWPWTDARLTEGVHTEANLTAGGASFAGLSQAEVAEVSEFERSWTVSLVDDADGDGGWDAARIAVTVRWPVPPGQRSTFRDVTLYTVKLSPRDDPARLTNHPANVRAIRVSVVARLPSQDPSKNRAAASLLSAQGAVMPAAGNRPQQAADDLFVRLRVETTEATRNLAARGLFFEE